jgi:hypothetical protein
LTLEPGSYRSVALSGAPERVGRLRLHTLRVVAWPRAKQ